MLCLAGAAWGHSGRGEPESRLLARLAEAAITQTARPVRYDPSYRRIPFPGGDVPADTGVCSDVVIRAYRTLGIDLQRLVHDDMTRAFERYPKRWGLRAPDPNIDHRRVPNLETYLARRGARRPVSRSPVAWAPGDLVVWTLSGNRPHIGIVTRRRSADGARPLVVHNAGWGPKLEDALFAFPITGHYRFGG
jgi:uncharacterized protein YijF (DUF1287 family)